MVETIFRISISSLIPYNILPNKNPIPSARQGGADRVLLHIPNKRLNGVVAAALPSGLVNETGGIICSAGFAHG
jgi:hypothetical protein